jgi:predicted nucleic acid-binding protein
MKCVLDANVALKWVLRERDSDKSRQLLVDYQQQIHDLLAPDIFPIEVAHALRGCEFFDICALDGGSSAHLTDKQQKDLHP